jgi:ribosomal protein S18 acetylase RimI-like enzyme
MQIDHFHPRDLAGTYRVCLATGASGADATRRYADPNLLGHVYAGPYVALEPAHAFVLRDGDQVVGYSLGALDTASFENACEMHWWPPLQAMYPPDTSRPERDAALVRKIHAPGRTSQELVESHPSHLHIDLLPVAQGKGHGRTLLEAVLASLENAGSPGVHLGVGASNTRAIGFYEHLGFERLRTTPGALVMGRRSR